MTQRVSPTAAAPGAADTATSPRPVLELGDPRLRARCAAVGSPLAGDLLADGTALQATLAAFRARHGFGRGIAAPQIGVLRRLIALDLGERAYPDGGRGPLLVVDPEVTWTSGETFTLWDDCMSFPWLLVRVRRHRSLSLRFRDGDGRERRWERVDPALSELLQHELDHLDGVLALDRAEPAAPGVDAVIGRAAWAADRERLRAQVDYAIGD